MGIHFHNLQRSMFELCEQVVMYETSGTPRVSLSMSVRMSLSADQIRKCDAPDSSFLMFLSWAGLRELKRGARCFFQDSPENVMVGWGLVHVDVWEQISRHLNDIAGFDRYPHSVDGLRSSRLKASNEAGKHSDTHITCVHVDHNVDF